MEFHEGAFGVRGTLDEWNWHASTSFGTDQAKEDTYNNINASLGPTSPTRFHYVGKLESVEWVNSLMSRADFRWEREACRYPLDFNIGRSAMTFLPATGSFGNWHLDVIPAGQPFAGHSPCPPLSPREAYPPPMRGTSLATIWLRISMLHGTLART